MFSSGLKADGLSSLALSRIEQKSLYVAGVFFSLTIVFSTFSIASTILSTVSLSGPAEKAIAAGIGVAIAPVVALSVYWIDRKATSIREKRSLLVSVARPLLLATTLGAAVCLAVIATAANGSLERTYLSALAGATLSLAGLSGCLFGTLLRARAAKQIEPPMSRGSRIATVVGMGNPG